MKNPRYWKLLAFTIAVIAISSLLFGCTKQKLEPMTNIWVSPCYIPGWLYNEAGEYLHVVYDDAYHTKDASPVTADSTMEILEESTWLAGVSATTPSYQIPDTGKLRFEVTVENASMRVESNEVFVWLELKSETETTMENAYMLLAAEGYIVSRPQSGYYVTDIAEKQEEGRKIASRHVRKQENPVVYDFATSNVDKESFRFELWRRYMKSAMRQDERLLSYGEPQGEQEFREVLSE